MGKKEDHEEFEKIRDNHKGKGYGCYVRHVITETIDGASVYYEECDYRLNSFNNLGSRHDLHNIDHYDRARSRGFLAKGGAFDDKLEADVEALRVKREKSQRWKEWIKRRIRESFGLLLQDKEAWWADHEFQGAFRPWFGPDRKKKRMPHPTNFKPLRNGGYHFYFPFKSNHHHMIGNSAIRTFVLDADPAGNSNGKTRREAVLTLKWNINRASNIILLPNELSIASVCKLPAHCPWETRRHPRISRQQKKDLKKIKDTLDEAVNTEMHEDQAKMASDQFTNTELDLLKKVRDMRGAL